MTATEEEAAEAYDIAAIKFRGSNAVTNFEMNRYDVEAIMNSSLPIGGAAKRLKISLESEQQQKSASSGGGVINNNTHHQQLQCTNMNNNHNNSSSISFSPIQSVNSSIPCGIPFDSTAAYYHHHNLFHHYNPTSATADSAISNPNHHSATPIASLPASVAADFFIWPPHQSY